MDIMLIILLYHCIIDMYNNILLLLLLLLCHFSCVRLCETPQTAAHQAPPSLGFSRQEHYYKEKRNGDKSIIDWSIKHLFLAD